MIEEISRQTRSPMRSIVSLCEQSGYQRATQKEPIKMRFMRRSYRKEYSPVAHRVNREVSLLRRPSSEVRT